MAKKTIYEHDGYLFADVDKVSAYIIKKIEDKYNNVDVSATAEFEEEWNDVEEKEVEWKAQGKNLDFLNDIFPILSTVKVLAFSDLDKERLNGLIKELQRVVDNL